MVTTYLRMIILWLFTCTPVFAHSLSTAWYAGLGAGRATVTGDDNRTIHNLVYDSGIEFEAPRWLFDFSTYTAQDNRFKGLTLIGAVGNDGIKIGTGFEGVQSSYPTQPGVVAGFFEADTSQDTDISVTSIPLFIRLHVLTSQRVSITLDGYVSLYTSGSIDIPVHTIIPGVSAKVSAQSRKTGHSAGGELSLVYHVSPTLGIRLDYQQRWGHMDAMHARVVGDLFGVTKPLTTPTLSMSNRVLLLSLVYHSE